MLQVFPIGYGMIVLLREKESIKQAVIEKNFVILKTSAEYVGAFSEEGGYK